MTTIQDEAATVALTLADAHHPLSRMTRQPQDRVARIDNIMAQHTISMITAALSTNPDSELRNLTIWLGLQGLTEQELANVYAGTGGYLAALLANRTPPGMARKQLVATVAGATTMAGLHEALNKQPAQNRATRRRKK